jgi:hypothetical protein
MFFDHPYVFQYVFQLSGFFIIFRYVMSVYFNLFYRKKKDSYSRNDELNVQVYYYYQKQKLNVSTGVSVKIKDWDDNWENNHGKNPVKKTDPEYQCK